MALLGGIEALTRRRVAGWAYDTDVPDMGVLLVVSIGSRVLGRCTADRLRGDLPHAGFDGGGYGFALDLAAGALSPREGYAISVRREGDGVHLPGSPYVLEPAVRIVW